MAHRSDAAAPFEACVAGLLRTDPDLAVPLARIHARLTARLGRGTVGTVQELHQRLAHRADLFMVLEAPEPSWRVGPCDEDTHEAYERAFRSLGIEPGARIALVQPVEVPAAADAGAQDVIRRLEASVLTLWASAPDDMEARGALFEAVMQAGELRAALDV